MILVILVILVVWSAERERKGEKGEDAEKLARQGSLNVEREGKVRHLLFIALLD